MKTTLLFDFTVNKESKTIHIKRELGNMLLKHCF